MVETKKMQNIQKTWSTKQLDWAGKDIVTYVGYWQYLRLKKCVTTDMLRKWDMNNRIRNCWCNRQLLMLNLQRQQSQTAKTELKIWLRLGLFLGGLFLFKRKNLFFLTKDGQLQHETISNVIFFYCSAAGTSYCSPWPHGWANGTNEREAAIELILRGRGSWSWTMVVLIRFLEVWLCHIVGWNKKSKFASSNRNKE